MNEKLNILVLRNDKLGDFMLIWPALSLLKAQYPNCRITVLVPPYTEPLATFCPWIDHVLLDEHHSLISDIYTLANKIRKCHFDISISMFTETRTALSTLLARIPLRIAPATKIAQIFSNSTLRQRRSESAKPEYEYNTELVRFLIEQQGDKPTPLPAPPYMKFDENETSVLRHEFLKQHNISPDLKLVIVHPGSGGSAINLSIKQYTDLIINVARQSQVFFVITAGPGEENTAQSLSSQLQNIKHCTYESNQGIISFSQFIAICDLFISGSTGTLHIAGALDIPTAAFYPARKSATSLRWQTLNSDNRRLAFNPDRYNGEDDMQNIDIKLCSQKINAFISQL